jgi:hypothetical protein
VVGARDPAEGVGVGVPRGLDAAGTWGCGAGYFVILRKKSKKTGQEVFFVVDIDPNRKRKGEGKKSKKKNNYQTDRALKLEKKFIEESEDF